MNKFLQQTLDELGHIKVAAAISTDTTTYSRQRVAHWANNGALPDKLDTPRIARVIARMAGCKKDDLL